MHNSTKSVRASKAKVKTGCVTCKIRRVKCDELRPSCHRCTRTGRKCDGYASTPPDVAHSATAPRIGRLALIEARAKEFFYHETVPQLSGFFGRPFWNIVLQFSLTLCIAEFGYLAELYFNVVDVDGCPICNRPFRKLLEARVGIIDIITAAVRVSQHSPPSSLLRKAANLNTALSRWKMQFDDLALRQEPLWGPQDRSRACMLRVIWQASEVGLSVGPAADETAWDAHKAAYEMIIQLVESLINDSQGLLQRFYFEMGLISPLHLVAWKCRWPSLRRKGFALLHASSRRECLYDSRLYHAVFSRIMAIEEGYLKQHLNEQSGQHHLPPEQARIHHFVCEPLSLDADGVYILKLFSRPKWPEPE